MSHLAFAKMKFVLIYFVSDKQFVVYECTETSWKEEDYEHALQNKKVVLETTYDGILEKAILVQVAQDESDSDAALSYCRAAKLKKKLTIETILKQVQRIRPIGRQIFPPFQVIFKTHIALKVFFNFEIVRQFIRRQKRPILMSQCQEKW